MAIYHYQPPSAVDEVIFVETEKGGVRAYLHAAPGAGDLSGVIEKLREKNLEVVPFMLGETPTLEVREFGKERHLLAMLKQIDAIKGTPAIERQPGDKLSWWDQLRKRSLQACGVLYTVGDVGFIRYAVKEGSKFDIIGGILYELGSMSLLTFGRNDQGDIQVHKAAKSLENFLHEEKIDPPEGSAVHAIAKERNQGFIDNAYDWMQTHPAELFNTIYIGAGSFITAGAIQHKLLKKVMNELPKERMKRLAAGWMDVGLGAVTASSALTGLMVEEKKPDPDEPRPTTMFGKAWEWVQEKPLRITGYGLLGSTMFHAGSTAIEYLRARRMLDPVHDVKTMAAIPGRAIFIATNIAGELLIAISSKGHGEGVTSDASVDQSTYAIAAELIARQPKEQRERYIRHIAAFLQQPNEMAETYDTVDAELRKQVALLEKNPWVGAEAQLPAPKQASTPSTLMQPAALNMATAAPSPTLAV